MSLRLFLRRRLVVFDKKAKNSLSGFDEDGILPKNKVDGPFMFCYDLHKVIGDSCFIIQKSSVVKEGYSEYSIQVGINNYDQYEGVKSWILRIAKLRSGS